MSLSVKTLCIENCFAKINYAECVMFSAIIQSVVVLSVVWPLNSIKFKMFEGGSL